MSIKLQVGMWGQLRDGRYTDGAFYTIEKASYPYCSTVEGEGLSWRENGTYDVTRHTDPYDIVAIFPDDPRPNPSPSFAEKDETLDMILIDIYEASEKLTKILKTMESEINELSTKPLAEMGISEKIRWAQLMKSGVKFYTRKIEE